MWSTDLSPEHYYPNIIASSAKMEAVGLVYYPGQNNMLHLSRCMILGLTAFVYHAYTGEERISFPCNTKAGFLPNHVFMPDRPQLNSWCWKDVFMLIEKTISWCRISYCVVQWVFDRWDCSIFLLRYMWKSLQYHSSSK